MIFTKTISNLENKVEYVFPYLKEYRSFYDLARRFEKNVALLHDEYFTYGGLNSDLLFNSYLANGYNVSRATVSEVFDTQLELVMPEVWYLNGGPHLLNTPIFFNKVQLGNENKKEQKEANQEFAKEVGYFGLVETFFRQKTLTRFAEDSIKAFSVIKTLPECVRVLEANIYEDILKGRYNSGRYRYRLIPYVPAALHYYNLIKQNKEKIADYDQEIFFKGMAVNQQIIKAEGTSPVRRCFVDLWKNVLLEQGIDPLHSEIIVTGTKFANNRQPDFVLIGDHDNQELQDKIINSDFAYAKTKKIYLRYEDSTKKFNLIKRNGKKWEWDPETYLLSLVLLKEAGYETEYQIGLDLYCGYAPRSKNV